MTEQLSHTRNAAATQGIPQVPGLPMLGNALSLIQDPIGFLVRSYLQFGPVFRAGAPGRWYTALAGPSANRFLLNGGERYLDNTAIYRHLAGELHCTNFASTTNGERNRHVRRMLKPAFSREATSRYLPGMFATAERVARTWQPEQRLPVLDLMQTLVAEQLGITMVNRSLGEMLPTALTFAKTSIGAGVGAYPAFMLRRPAYRASRARMFDFMRQIVAAHRAEPPGSGREPDFVDLLLAARDIHGAPLTDVDVIANAQMVYSPGMLYAAPACAFLLYALLKEPDLLRAVTAEVDAVFADGLPDATMLRRMPLLHGATLESMRLHPIALATPRVVTTPFEFEGYTVEAGQSVLIVFAVCHFLPEFFPDPYRFDVERFGEGRNEHRQPGVYAPFGLGPHACIAPGLVTLLVMATVATLLWTVQLQLDPPDYTLRKVVNPFPTPERKFRVRVLGQRPRPAQRVGPSHGVAEQMAIALPALDRDQLNRIAASVQVLTYTPGTRILQQGDPADRFYIITKGEVEVIKEDPGQAPHVIDRLGSGQYFGEIGLLHGTSRTATVRAVSHVAVLALEREAFLAIVADADLTSAEIAAVAQRRALQADLARALPRLSADQLVRAASGVEVQHYAPGSTIIHQGDPADTFYIITKGMVEVVNHHPSGRDIVLDHLERGDYFGEIGILQDRPRTATVRASSDGEVEVMALGRAALLGLIGDSQPTGEAIAMVMGERLVRLAEHAGDPDAQPHTS